MMTAVYGLAFSQTSAACSSVSLMNVQRSKVKSVLFHSFQTKGRKLHQVGENIFTGISHVEKSYSKV